MRGKKIGTAVYKNQIVRTTSKGATGSTLYPYIYKVFGTKEAFLHLIQALMQPLHLLYSALH